MLKRGFLVLSLLVMGCSGKKGDKGDTGIQGIRGPGNMQVLSGTVTSDDFTVTNSDIGFATQINVYMNVGGSTIQLPIFNTSGGFNVLYSKLGSSIRIQNALSGSGSSFTIVLILP